MKVLLLGMNYASTLNSLVPGFKAHSIEVKALSFEQNRSVYNRFDQIDCVFPNSDLSFFAYKWKTIKGLFRLYASVKKADVIHVYSNLVLPTRYEQRILNHLFLKVARNKKKFVTYVGSEVRIPEMDFDTNPYYKKTYSNPDYEYSYESESCSFKHQQKFADLGFELIGTPDTLHYMNPNYFKTDKVVFHAGVAEKGTKSESSGEILVIHAPTAPIAKGSSYIREAMEKICAKHPNVRFRELQHLSNLEYQHLINNCDIYIDQLIWGFHGVAAIQAMALEKPVLCYLHPEFLQYVSNPPIINSNPDNLPDQLEALIANPEKLPEIGKRSREYYLQFHTPEKVASQLIPYYSA
ncbi:glycosyltransferase [uncultured Fluviicola sp.]|uniref:glycosyltransferase n=1 Tax=uncultured Fluviicola sp. TaxID=463303 RepID=UPI0025F75B5A|nr:glycosyltransferase [uncultured Fluviicola sp.]